MTLEALERTSEKNWLRTYLSDLKSQTSENEDVRVYKSTDYGLMFVKTNNLKNSKVWSSTVYVSSPHNEVYIAYVTLGDEFSHLDIKSNCFDYEKLKWTELVVEKQ